MFFIIIKIYINSFGMIFSVLCFFEGDGVLIGGVEICFVDWVFNVVNCERSVNFDVFKMYC